jgi:hypothetical protein
MYCSVCKKPKGGIKIMIVVAKEDVLKGLKKFKRLAKQDLLVSQFTADPDFWIRQAEGRRNTYSNLMELVDEHGVDHAYQYAVKKYASLPFVFADKEEEAEVIGKIQAFEMFFTILGVQPPVRKELKPSNDFQRRDFAANAPH